MEQNEISRGTYYLKKCIMVLRSAEFLSPLLPLGGRLAEVGIACEVMLSEELLDAHLVTIDRVSVSKTLLSAVSSGQEVGMTMHRDIKGGEEGVLYLTDDPQVYFYLTAGTWAMGDSADTLAMGNSADTLAMRDSADTLTMGNSADTLAMGDVSHRGFTDNCQPPILIYLHPGNRDADFGNAGYALEDPEEVEPEYLERVYRRCHDLPWEILTTQHCWLRETTEADVDSFWSMYQAPELTRYTEKLYPDLEAERSYVREYRKRFYRFYEFGVWTVLDRTSGEIVGRAGLSVREGYDLPELGFVIGDKWQGRGLATEVCRGILKYAEELLGFTRIQVLVHEDNALSLHLCRKLGFQEEAVPEELQSIVGLAGILPPYMVEMEQNGKQCRFIYMVRHAENYRVSC